MGRAVADTGWVGVFSMATLPYARKRGAGMAVVIALARWAESITVHHLYLQVVCENLIAQRLYQGAGFTEIAVYHYRTGARSTS